jgi:hypothetical protein
MRSWRRWPAKQVEKRLLGGIHQIVIWRSVLVAAYIGIPLAGYLAWGGIGWAWLMFFAVWGIVWFGFSAVWAWALRVRRVLLQRPTSS